MYVLDPVKMHLYLEHVVLVKQAVTLKTAWYSKHGGRGPISHTAC